MAAILSFLGGLSLFALPVVALAVFIRSKGHPRRLARVFKAIGINVLVIVVLMTISIATSPTGTGSSTAQATKQPAASTDKIPANTSEPSKIAAPAKNSEPAKPSQTIEQFLTAEKMGFAVNPELTFSVKNGLAKDKSESRLYVEKVDSFSYWSMFKQDDEVLKILKALKKSGFNDFREYGSISFAYVDNKNYADPYGNQVTTLVGSIMLTEEQFKKINVNANHIYFKKIATGYMLHPTIWDKEEKAGNPLAKSP